MSLKLRAGRRFRESAFNRLAQVVTAPSTRVPVPVTDDTPVGGDHQGLWNCAPPVHQRARGLAVGPAQAEPEIETAHELLHAVGRRARVFSR